MDENNKDNNGTAINNTPVANEPEVSPASTPTPTPAQEEVKEVVSENTVTTTAVETPVTDTLPSIAPAPEATEATKAVAVKGRNILIQYGLMALAVVVIGLGLLFILEKEGRVTTSLFTPIIESIKAKEAVAKVNGVEIVRGDYENSLRQLTSMYEAQGADVTDEEIKTNLAKESLETLINGEVLRQEAVKAGMTADAEKVNARLKEIETSIGGAEALAERMAEFSVTQESLLRDIENEILIQGLFDTTVVKEVQVTEEEIQKFYNDAVGPATDLPPLAEVKDQIEASIKSQKEQEQVASFLEEVKAKATIERLI